MIIKFNYLFQINKKQRSRNFVSNRMGIKVGQTLPFCAVNVNGPLVAFYCLVVVFLKVVLTDDGQKVTVTSIQPMHI